jgi:hypothetical protein
MRKNGGWKTMYDENGNQFKNQNDCVSVYATSAAARGQSLGSKARAQHLVVSTFAIHHILVSRLGFEPRTRGLKACPSAVHRVIWRPTSATQRGVPIHQVHAIGRSRSAVAVSVAVSPSAAASGPQLRWAPRSSAAEDSLTRQWPSGRRPWSWNGNPERATEGSLAGRRGSGHPGGRGRSRSRAC